MDWTAPVLLSIEEAVLTPLRAPNWTAFPELDSVRFALSANPVSAKRRKPGDYRKGFFIAVKCGLCDLQDVEAVRTLLTCSDP